ncbi:MAG: acyl-CoA desaturase, partial [Acidimicrobiales bacterium]
MSSTPVLTREPSVLAPPPADSAPPPAEDSPPASTLVPRLVTALLVVGPVVALGIGIPFLWGHVIHLRDVIIGLVLFLVTGYGISAGFHRLFSHRSFVAKRPLKIGLAIAGSMAVEGSVIGWVSAHRVHHRFTDRPGDPHSPFEYGDGVLARLRGAAHAHVGWLFKADADWNGATRDLERDHDIVRISDLFPLFAIGSLAIPFGLGWLLSGTLTGALTTFLWAGAVRMMLLHHVTWSVNSIGHLFGSRPFRTNDRSRN